MEILYLFGKIIVYGFAFYGVQAAYQKHKK